MKDRDSASQERSPFQFYVEVRRYWRDPRTGLVLPEPIEQVRLLPNQAVVFGRSLYQPVVISNSNPEALIKEIDLLRQDYKEINRLNGIAITSPGGKITVELPDGQQQSADLSGGHKANTAYLVGPDGAILGAIGATPGDLQTEIEYREKLFPRSPIN